MEKAAQLVFIVPLVQDILLFTAPEETAVLAGMSVTCAQQGCDRGRGSQHWDRSLCSGRGQLMLQALTEQPVLERSQPCFAGWATVLLINGDKMKNYRSQFRWNYENTCYETLLEPCSWPAPEWNLPLNLTASVVSLSFFKAGVPCSLL